MLALTYCFACFRGGQEVPRPTKIEAKIFQVGAMLALCWLFFRFCYAFAWKSRSQGETMGKTVVLRHSERPKIVSNEFLGPVLACLGPVLACLGLPGTCLGSVLVCQACLGPVLNLSWPVLTCLEPVLNLSWPFLGPSWACLRPSWNCLGAFLDIVL